MRVAIIGVGNVGSALARATKVVGHEVVVSATTPDKARSVAGDLGVDAAGSNREAAAGADAVILAVPFAAVQDVVATSATRSKARSSSKSATP